MALIAKETIYADSQGQLCGADDPDASLVVARKGVAVNQKTIDRYGLKDQVGEAPADHGTAERGPTYAELTGQEEAAQEEPKEPAPKAGAAPGVAAPAPAPAKAPAKNG